MLRSPWSTTATAVCIILLSFSQQIHAHMEMSKPYPINSQLDPSVPEQLKDYSYTSPLFADGSNFPCKGYQNQRPVVRSASYEAGKTYTMDIYGSATHGGGSCQISLSYDNGKTFRVIKSMIGGCPLTSSYDFTVPSFAPAGTALLAWTWMNLVGNREYYMNCAWVDIAGSAPAQQGGSSHNGPLSGPEYTAPGSSPSPPRRKKGKGRKAPKGNALSASSSSSSSSVASNETDVAELVRRKTYTSFDQLPFIWKANLPPENNCVTVEGVTPVFPNPGPDVVYGSGVSASTPPSKDLSCDAAGPPGPAYKNLPIGPFGQYAGVGGGSGGGGGAGSGGTTTSAPLPTTTSTSATLTLTTSIASPTLPSIPSPTLSSIPSPTLPSIPSPTLPSVTSPTLPGFPSASPSVRPIRHSRCDSSVSGQGLKCLRKGTGFAICDNNYWVDMGPVAYGTKCQGPAGRAIIVASGWA